MNLDRRTRAAVLTHMTRHDEPDDQAVQAERLREDQDENHANFCNNIIKTTKYTLLTFVPLNLLT